MSSKEIVSMRGIVKRFQGVTALDGVDFSINAGEVMCLLGENGAGKSTLIKILSGSYTPDAGEIFFEGKAVTIKTPRMATELGISVVHQELDLVPDLTVAQNLFLGRTPSRFGFIKNSNMQEVAEAAIARVGGQFSPKTKVSELTVVQKQLTMIARALTIEAKLLIMDEPSATLTADELQQVFRVMDEVTKAGCAILYISHRLDEISQIGDRATVLRDGKSVGVHKLTETSQAELIEEIIGGKRGEVASQRSSIAAIEDKNSGLYIDRVFIPGVIDIRNVSIPRGRITGFIGLGGAGRSTLLSALFGSERALREVSLDGQPYDPHSPRQAIARRVGLVPEDRKIQGLMVGRSIWHNMIIAFNKKGFGTAKQRSFSKPKEIASALGVRFHDFSQLGGQLSGGNQQKVVLSKWLVNESNVLLLDEPTRGLDVGAKVELFNEVHKIADSGAAVAVTSSELPEVMMHCDTIYVLYEGQVKEFFVTQGLSAEDILHVVITGEVRNA